MFRRINLSSAIIALICFFLPWEQVSCGGARDSLSGWDLARHDHASLWLVPMVMVILMIVALLRAGQRRIGVISVAGMLAGLSAAYVMNRERLRVSDESGLIAAQLTGWFWLGLFASLVVFISALLLLPREGGRAGP